VDFSHARSDAFADDGFLIFSQHPRVIDRTVMMHLTPFSVSVSPKDARCANCKLHRSSGHIELASLASDHVEQITGLVQGVVVELE